MMEKKICMPCMLSLRIFSEKCEKYSQYSLNSSVIRQKGKYQVLNVLNVSTKCSFFGKSSVFCFIFITPVLIFALLPTGFTELLDYSTCLTWPSFVWLNKVRVVRVVTKFETTHYQPVRSNNRSIIFLIWDALRDLVSFAQFKKRRKNPWRSATLSKAAV